MTLTFVPWGEEPPLFDWDDDNIGKFLSHGVYDFEVEQCFENEYQAIRKKSKIRDDERKDRYWVLGVTDSGRRLQILIQHKGGSVIRPITGWDA